jgi:hypothetical protein
MYFTYFSFVRYNETIVKSICKRLEESSPTALEEFIKLCVPLFSSDQTFLFETLVNCVSNDPDKLNDAWISMQEANFIPSDGLMLKMAKMFQSHGEEVPFSVDHIVDDQPPIEEIAKKPEKKVTQKELESNKNKLKKKVTHKELESTKHFEDFATKLAEENLEEVSNILLKVCISDLTQWFQLLLSNPHSRQNYYVLSKLLKCLCTLYLKKSKVETYFTYPVFPRIVVATTILFWRVGCDNYSRETTIQRRKLLFFLDFWKCT